MCFLSSFLDTQISHHLYISGRSEAASQYQDIFPCQFRTDELQVRDGRQRFRERQGIDFVILKVQDHDDVWAKLQPLLQIIEKGVQDIKGQWDRSIGDHRNELHVTMRKYDDKGSWSKEHIRNSGIVERVRSYQLGVPCVALEIILARRQSVQRTEGPWWLGVTGNKLPCPHCGKNYREKSPGHCRACDITGDDHECTGCSRRENRRRAWAGFCPGCWNYERIRPVWSTLGANN